MRMNYIYIPLEGKATTSMIAARVGSRYEDATIKGVSHFVEHMCFKGTEKMTAKEIHKALDKYGSEANAFTDKEITAYWVKSANQFKDVTFKVVEDFTLNPIFPENEVNKEREVILQELKRSQDYPARWVWALTGQELFDAKSGFHLPTLGTVESLKGIDRNVLIDFHKKNYNDLIMIKVGDVKEYTDVKIKDSTFLTEKKLITEPTTKLFPREGIKQANVLISNIAKPKYSKVENFYLFMVYYSILSGVSGRLWQKIREENHLVYNVGFCLDQHSCGTIVWNVAMGLDKDKIEMARNLVADELTRPVDKKELEYSVNKLIGSTELQLDDTKSVAELAAYATIKGIDYREFIYNYRKNITKMSKKLNEFITDTDFKNNLLVGIVPK